MKFKIQKQVFEKFPNLVVAIPIIFGFDNSQTNETGVKFLREQEEEAKKKYDLETTAKDPRVACYFDAFTKFGVDPTVSLPTHWALTKRVLEGGQIPDINPIVDLYNGMSVKYLTPFGGEDLDQVCGDFRLEVAKGGEKWIPIGSKKSKPCVAGELIWEDDFDVSTRVLNWRQCERTKLTSKSKNGYFIMDGFEGINKDNIEKAADEFLELMTKNFGGQGKVYWLTKENPEIEIDFKSKKPEDFIVAPIEKKTLKTRVVIEGSMMHKIEEILKQAGFEAEVTRTTNENFGDYTTNIAMVLAKKQGKSPIEIANEIKGKLEKIIDNKIIEKVEVVGGYINFFVKPEYLIESLEKQEVPQTGKGKTMVIDYSAPNIAKPFGIGHLRSTNIGQAIYNIYQTLGWKCIGDNHLGDWGTQFGKMITAIKHWGQGDVEKMTIADLEKLYVKFHEEAEKDEKLKDEAREWFSKLEKKDKEAGEIWQKCVDISLVEFNRVYKMLGVKIDYALGEAFYSSMWQEILEEFKKKGLAKESQGALIVEFDDLPPAMLLKTDDATTYFTRDLATIKYRMETWKPDFIVYEVGAEQKLHFAQVFAAAKLAGWEPSSGFYHLGHGLIRWATGKFSTRSGDTIHLSDVIDNAVKVAKKIAETSKISKEMGVEENEKMIMAVAIGAVKFSDLSSDPKKDVIFDWDKIMSLDGDSGPYLQYTFARCASLSQKSKVKSPTYAKATAGKQKFNVEEMGLVRELGKFPEKIVEAGERLAPSVVAEYLLALARKYNEFYNKYRIIGEPEEEWRLWLTQKTAETIKKGLGLLGVETVERM